MSFLLSAFLLHVSAITCYAVMSVWVCAAVTVTAVLQTQTQSVRQVNLNLYYLVSCIASCILHLQALALQFYGKARVLTLL